MKHLKTVAACAVASLALLTSCNNSDKQKNQTMNTHHRTTEGSDYACSMHPEVKGKKGEKCPKCGMALEAIAVAENAPVEVIVTSDPITIEAEKPTDISIAIKENGRNVELDMAHEKKMHLMIVDEKLTWFDHIHPEEQADGTYKVSESFPYGGKYLLYADYKPMGSAGLVYSHEIEVRGTQAVNNAGSSIKLTSAVDGYIIELVNGDDFKSERNQTLQFSVRKEDKELRKEDLQNYLGAGAHIVMIGKADKEFLHIHPVPDHRFPIFAETSIDKPGLYRIWVQFQISGKVRTADFTVNVSKGEKIAADHSDNHNHNHQH